MKYEIMTIYKNDIGEDGAKDLSNKLKEVIESMGGKDLKNDFWGRRKFAYELDHNVEGFYDIFNFEFESEKVSKLKEKLNQINGLVRYLFTAQR